MKTQAIVIALAAASLASPALAQSAADRIDARCIGVAMALANTKDPALKSKAYVSLVFFSGRLSKTVPSDKMREMVAATIKDAPKGASAADQQQCGRVMAESGQALSAAGASPQSGQ